LIPLAPGNLTASEITATMAFAEAEKAASTREVYAADWRAFAVWCHARAATPLPAHPGIIAAYLSSLATEGRKASTIGRKLAAIAYRHKLAGIDPLPTSSEGVRATLRGIRRSIGTARQGKAPATHDLIAAMLANCGESMIGKRDRAVLAFGFASAMRRSELCALQVEDLTETPDGLRVLIRRSKGDQEGAGQEIAIPRGYKLRPVEALQGWLAAAEINAGPVFRPVAEGGKVADIAISTDGLCRIVKRHASRIGLDPADIGAHSLRSGYITSGAQTGATIWKLIEHSRHRSVETLRGYVRSVDLWRDHSGAAFL
jgi:integrase